MPRRSSPLFLLLILSLSLPSLALDNHPIRTEAGRSPTRVGATIGLAKTEVDTTFLLGGPGRLDGRFEDASGNPHWQGWTHEDFTSDDEIHWHVSDFMALGGLYSMWCGMVFPGGDPGYGNSWRQRLVFTHQVSDNAVASTVVWTASLRYDVEPGYDYVYIEVNRGGSWQTLQTHDGERTIAVNETITVAPTDYVGQDLDEIQLRVHFVSDGAWSDEDGLWDTDGACQYDDVTVTVDGVVVDVEDFEDQVSDRWQPSIIPGVGDFAALYTNLLDMDPCVSNSTAQVAFVDDGVVVPGTGGTPCITWCYGPGGYIVNNTGGLLGPNAYINNLIVSPALTWPAGADGAILEFDVYRHEELGEPDVWPGIFYQWHVRSVNTGNPSDLESAPWRSQPVLYYGGPDYRRQHEIVSNFLMSGRTHVQVSLRVLEIWGCWWWYGTDGTPAPYFDNVRLMAYPYEGPSVVAFDLNLFNDSFPASGEIDLDNLSANSVRLDMARNISPAAHLRNDPGDSIVVDVKAIRAGSVLAQLPQLHVRLKANPLFRDVRTLPPGFILSEGGAGAADLVTGTVDGDSTFNEPGILVADRYNFDLPDEGFFFPGDVLHYYVDAYDNLAGDIGHTVLPADTTGFAAFTLEPIYNNLFTVRALPTLHSGSAQPTTLLWNDHGDDAAQEDWWSLLEFIGRNEGEDYDLYCTNQPSSGRGNGLGGRATAAQLAGYEIILYTAGDQTNHLLGNGDFASDPSDDLGVLMSWLDQSGGNLLLTGDNVVTGLMDSGMQGELFRTQYLGVEWVERSILYLIGQQTTPLVVADDHSLFHGLGEWIVAGGCPDINDFDAVTAGSDMARAAEFTDPGGSPGVYPYAAAVADTRPWWHSHLVLLPYDLRFVNTAPGWTPPAGHDGYTARALMLESVLEYLGDWIVIPGVTPEMALRVSHYPNPFNPTTTIALDLPRASEVNLKIYNLRGQLVRTLMQERLAAGHHEIVWNGTDDRGAVVASGVYFSEVKANGEVRVHKLALVK